MTKSPLSERDFPVVVDVIPPGVLADQGILTALPVVEPYQPADQCKWCLAVHEWLADGCAPPAGCPTNDLLADGLCRRNSKGGRCLLLLPFSHVDWQPALRERYDVEQGAFLWRDEPAAPPLHRHPLTLEEVEG